MSAKNNKNLGALTVCKALALSMPSGYAVLADFLADVDSGKVTSTESVKILASRFRACFDAGADPMRLLELKPGRRQPPLSAGAWEKRHAKVLRKLDQQLDSQPWPLPRGAVSNAIRAVGNKDIRNTKRIWAKYRPLYTAKRLFPMVAIKSSD